MDITYFDELRKKRTKLADSFDDPAATGVWNSVIDKYSEQAHFIYELLQNADDTKATYARFILYDDRLIFAHNGERQFSISDPSTEKEDRKNGCLGDVNAILSIGHSSKITPSTIGKFGIGFKAVFQYTNTPCIYAPSIRFKIERYIVPTLIPQDHPDRKADETLFEFPFNHNINNADTAYDEISDRLARLINPILFLSNLQDISYKIGSTQGVYKKEITKTYQFGNTTAEYLILTNAQDDKQEKKFLWLFSRFDDKCGRYAVGYYTDENGDLIPVDEPAYCFFPTQVKTGLHFIIHAPFLLTDSREGIKFKHEHNIEMFNLLAQLAADSLICLRDIGLIEDRKLLNDKIIYIVPTCSFTRTGIFGDVEYESPFQPFFTKMNEAFKSEQIIPAKDTYAVSKNAYWAHTPSLISAFNTDALCLLTNNPDAKWVFTTISRNSFDKYYDSKCSFIERIISKGLNEDKLLKLITPTFIQSQSIEWLADFYKWINETNARKNICRTLPIFLDSNGNAVSAYNENGNRTLFFESDNENGYATINTKLLENADILSLIQFYGITKPSLKDDIYNKIIPQLNHIALNTNIEASRKCFLQLFNYYLDCSRKDKEKYLSDLKQHNILIYFSMETGKLQIGSGKDIIYYPSNEMKEYFTVKPSTKFVDLEGYLQLVGKSNENLVCELLSELGVLSCPKIRPFAVFSG